jgi:hypothetical protein
MAKWNSEPCSESKSETRNSLEPGVANGHFQRPQETLATLIGPLMDPRLLLGKPLPNTESLDAHDWLL